MKVNLEKCRFLQRSVEYLGHVVTDEGTKPDPKKVEAITNYLRPQNVREVRDFLGLAGYYHRFLSHFGDS